MQKYRELTIRELKHQFPVSHITDELSDDIFIAELRYASEMDIIKHPCRFDGYLAFFCYEGHFDIEVNLRTFQVREGSLFLYTPGNIVRVSEISPKEKKNVQFLIIAVSNALIRMTHFDFNKLYDESLRLLENPCVTLEGETKGICKKYLDLVRDICSMSLPNKRDAVSSLISSIFYLMGRYGLTDCQKQSRNRKRTAPSARRPYSRTSSPSSGTTTTRRGTCHSMPTSSTLPRNISRSW